jgi:radical SAM modification target selenobiotic family peptide
MQSRDIKSYLAGFCVAALLTGSGLAMPKAAVGSSG